MSTALTLPNAAGAGLRIPHVGAFQRGEAKANWVEVHSENYMCAGGARLRHLENIREDHPLSCHGVALSLGSADGVDAQHLARLKDLVDRFEPSLVSDHISWSVIDGIYLNDLLPLPYTEEALDVLCRNIEKTQEALGRSIAVENPSTYAEFSHSTCPEWEFVGAVCKRTGCQLLLDVNNIYVSATNHGFDPHMYLANIPPEVVAEIHVAGHSEKQVGNETILVDTHSRPVIDAVWDLLGVALHRTGPRPVLVEWDAELPKWPVLEAEVQKAQTILDQLTQQPPGAQSNVA